MSAPSKSAQQQRRERQMLEAEELLFSEDPRPSFAKELFAGRFAADLVLPYPKLKADEPARVSASLDELRTFCDAALDADEIDRQADIPREVIDGLSRIGLLGMTAPEEIGGRGFSQLAYCRLLEELGARCSATSIFINAHHSIGMRALLLFGTEQQKRQWLPDLVNGSKLAAFALTETQAGSDAANVQTTAKLSEDGSQYVLNGSKRYITNGAIADVLTVMARTDVPGGSDTAVTAFLVTPDMPGFHVEQPRMDKLGIRGTATAKLKFEDMRVPSSHVLGPLGKGLRVALTVLDFGRTTFGACCTGSAKTCLRLATEHARSRVQFGQPLIEFELIRKKLALMAAWTYAMEAMTNVTAGLIDRGDSEYMLETAMLKVWSTERLWTIVNDAFQIHGGAAYFTDRPLARMLRDARINQIGEGANEVLTSFIGLVGMREPGEQLRHVAQMARRPWRGRETLWGFITHELGRRLRAAAVPVDSPALATDARNLGRLIRAFGLSVQKQLITHREQIIDQQLVHERIAEAAMELYASACVLSRRQAELNQGQDDQRSAAIADLLLKHSARRIRTSLQALVDNNDSQLRAAAGAIHQR